MAATGRASGPTMGMISTTSTTLRTIIPTRTRTIIPTRTRTIIPTRIRTIIPTRIRAITPKRIRAIAITTIMTTDGAKRLRLQSWFSPAFPIGAFSYSHGLEWAVEEGSVTDRASLLAWLEADLRHGSGLMDAMVFAQAWRATHMPHPLTRNAAHSALSHEGREQGAAATYPSSIGPEVLTTAVATRAECPLPSRERAATHSPGEGESSVKRVDVGCDGAAATPPAQCEPAFADSSKLLAVAELAAAMRGTTELALESGQQGIAFLSAVRKAWPHPELDRFAALLTQAAIPPVLPVAAGICCAVHGIDLDLALPVYVHGSVANLVNAAVRLVPLGQTDGQIAVAALEASVLETAREAMASAPEDIGSTAFMVDLASMRHETQYTRLFRS